MANPNGTERNTSRAVLANIRIFDVWQALTGEPIRHGRVRATWRGGDCSLYLNDPAHVPVIWPAGAIAAIKRTEDASGVLATRRRLQAGCKPAPPIR
jgi:hypothetical protein